MPSDDTVLRLIFEESGASPAREAMPSGAAPVSPSGLGAGILGATLLGNSTRSTLGSVPPTSMGAPPSPSPSGALVPYLVNGSGPTTGSAGSGFGSASGLNAQNVNIITENINVIAQNANWNGSGQAGTQGGTAPKIGTGKLKEDNAGGSGDPATGMLGKMTGLLATALGGLTAALHGAVQAIQANTDARVAAVRGDDPAAIRMRQTQSGFNVAGASIAGAGTAIGLGLMATGVGIPIGAAVIGGSALAGGAIATVGGGLASEGDRSFIAGREALNQRIAEISRYDARLSGALARSQNARQSRDIGEAGALSGQYSRLTELESTYSAAQQKNQAISRALEARDLMKQLIYETEKVNANTREMMKKYGAGAEAIVKTIAGGGKSPIRQLLDGLVLPTDHTPQKENALQKMRDSQLGRSFFN
jgi:hypothetical protein